MTHSCFPSASRRTRFSAIAGLVFCVVGLSTPTAAQAPTSARANSYDDAWQAQWVSHASALLRGASKTDGFILQIGDSLTHSFAYAMWPKNGSGKTADDAAVLSWARASQWGAGPSDVTQKNGWYLAAADTTPQRGMTSASGVSLQEFVSGCCNGGPAMPVRTLPSDAQATVADGTYTGNLQIDTVATAFYDAQFAVVMLGTNDPGNTANMQNLTLVVDSLEAHGIVPILSTIPPRNDAIANDVVIELNAAVRRLAEMRSLPLVDLYQEIVLRRPGTTWVGTLISTDGVHLTASGAGYSSDSNPYGPGGDATTHTTGDAALNVGYLLRSWLVVQKLKEVKAHVIDGVNSAPTVALTSPSAGATYTSPAVVALAASSNDDGAIRSVQFFANGSLLATDTSAPYETTWTDVAVGEYSLKAAAVDDQGATTESAPVLVSVVAPSSMHVGDLDAGAGSSGKQNWRASVTVAVHDGMESAAPGAVVSGQWSGGYSGAGSCTTDGSGACVVNSGNINVKKASTSFSVTTVTHPRLTYRQAANHDGDGSSNGSVVVVPRP